MNADKARPRLVLDTNVFVSGLISGTGPPAQILRSLQERRVVHLVSDPIVEEYLRVLKYPRIRKFRKITDAFIADIAAYLVYQTERVELVSGVRLSRDPDDDVFLGNGGRRQGDVAGHGRQNGLALTGSGGRHPDRLGPRSGGPVAAIGHRS